MWSLFKKKKIQKNNNNNNNKTTKKKQSTYNKPAQKLGGQTLAIHMYRNGDEDSHVNRSEPNIIVSKSR